MLDKGKEHIELFTIGFQRMMSLVCRPDVDAHNLSEVETRVPKFLNELDAAMCSMFPILKKPNESSALSSNADSKSGSTVEANSGSNLYSDASLDSNSNYRSEFKSDYSGPESSFDHPISSSPTGGLFSKSNGKQNDFLEINRKTALSLLVPLQDRSSKLDLDKIKNKIMNESHPDAMRNLLHTLIDAQTQGVELFFQQKIEERCVIT